MDDCPQFRDWMSSLRQENAIPAVQCRRVKDYSVGWVLGLGHAKSYE